VGFNGYHLTYLLELEAKRIYQTAMEYDGVVE
jgi:hypothetical protein